MDEHKTCKAKVLRRLERISYLINDLKNMKWDECPATKKIDMRELDVLQVWISALRRESR
jgi:hypothetical protein